MVQFKMVLHLCKYEEFGWQLAATGTHLIWHFASAILAKAISPIFHFA
jgi:hypothetical protein